MVWFMVHYETFFLFELFSQSLPSCLKVIGWVGASVYVVARKILVSAPVPLGFFWDFEQGWTGLGLVLGTKGFGTRA